MKNHIVNILLLKNMPKSASNLCFLLLFVILSTVAGCGQKQSSESESSESNEQTTQETQPVAEQPIEPDGVFFQFPNDGDKVTSPVLMGFGVKGMVVEPAGEVTEGKGHHHIIIDNGYIEEGVVIPADSVHIHYGKGQLQASVELSPGKHTLTMQFADGVHKSYGEAWSKTIEITVTE